MDRIDLFSAVHDVEHAKLLSGTINKASDTQTIKRINDARHVQAKRYNSGSKLNNDMNNADIHKHACLSPEAKQLLDSASVKLNVSARSYMRTVKVARTIADLESSTNISENHISEALAYRAGGLK